MYQIKYRDQNDAQNTIKIHNDWLRPARHLNRCCIENKIIITKKKSTSNLQPKLPILKLISGHELFPFTDQLKEFPTTFREIVVHKSTDLGHYQYLNLLSRNKRILNPYFLADKCCCTNYHWLQQYSVGPYFALTTLSGEIAQHRPPVGI